MRLLLRANSHRTAPDGSVEIASSPDTPRPEPWQWHLRVCDAPGETPPGTATAAVKLDGTSGAAVLVVTVDPATVSPHAELLDLTDPALITRHESELVVLVVGEGVVLAEGRHLLGALDALVLASDDPLRLQVEQASADTVSAGLVRLQPAGAGSIAWVP